MIPSVFGHPDVPLVFEGTAYDFDNRIESIEFSMDMGKTWTEYKTEDTVDYRTVMWSLTWTPKACGQYRLHVRSVSRSGKRSPKEASVDIFVS